MNKKIKTKVVFIVILLVLLIIGVFLLFAYRYYLDKMQAPTTEQEEVAFTIEEGESISSVLTRLEEEGLIQDADVAKLYVRLYDKDNYYAGNFVLTTNMSVYEIIDVITDVTQAARQQVTLTITPGDWAKDIAAKIAEITDLESDEILEKWNDMEYVDSLIEEYECLTEDIFNSEHCYLEGYLMPETYYIYENSTIEQVTERILEQTEAVYEEYKEQFEASEFSTHEIFTLASIVVFEANSYEDMQGVASVFYNRLEAGMYLRSSVTVCYALYDYEDWTECETKVYDDSSNNEYNTYVYEGLPIGPICNASASAIEATLNPLDTNYYYFIGNLETGETIFAETYAEHQANVEKYLNGIY